MNSGKVPAMRGVRVTGVVEDQSELPRVYLPGHPDADAEGFVRMPNVQLPPASSLASRKSGSM